MEDFEFDELEKIVEELEPYKGLTGSEPDELLYHLLSIAESYMSYVQTEDFERALLKELTTIRDDYKENWEIVEEERTVTHTYRTLELK